MRKKGVKIPDPVRGKNGKYAFPKIPDKVLNAPGRQEERRRPRPAAPQPPPQLWTAAERAAFKKFSDCMAKNGAAMASRWHAAHHDSAATTDWVQRGSRAPIFNSNHPRRPKKALAKGAVPAEAAPRLGAPSTASARGAGRRLRRWQASSYSAVRTGEHFCGACAYGSIRTCRSRSSSTSSSGASAATSRASPAVEDAPAGAGARRGRRAHPWALRPRR